MQLIWAYRQSLSLKNILCPSNIIPFSNRTRGSKKCGKSGCQLCNIIMVKSNFCFENGESFEINGILDCDSKFVIYAISCNCSKIYIGESVDLRLRMNLHKSHISNPDESRLYVSKHIRICKKGFKFIPIFSMKDDNLIERKIHESHFINKFKPSLNRSN